MAYLFLILVLFPLMAAGAIAFLYSHSLLSPLLVLVGMTTGAITIVFSGLIWLQSMHSDWLQSQAAGFIFLPVILPFYAYIGAVAGASLVAILYGHNKHHGISVWFVVAAVGLTIVLAGFMPAAIFATPSIDVGGAGGNRVSTASGWFWVVLPIVTAAMGTACAGLSSAFTFWIFSLCRLMR